jgi:arylsulfatase A-like enzyme
MTRRKILSISIPSVLFLLLISSFLLITTKNKLRNADLNVILISIDTLRADHLSCYGYSKPTTPNIDDFRQDAVLFNRCIAQSSSTLQSHASMLTSLVPLHHGASFAKKQGLPNVIKTLAELLKEKGFKTVSFNDGGQLAPAFGLNQGFDVYRSTKKKFDEFNFAYIVTKTIDWIEENPDRNFFMFLHTYETHTPYTPKEKHLRLFDQNYAGRLPAYTSEGIAQKINKGDLSITEEDRLHIIHTYDAEIKSMDESFQTLIDYLRNKKLYERTIIIFTSDHGEEFNEHGVMATHSHTLFNELLHIPLIVKFENSKFASRQVNKLVRSIDIMPTLLDKLNIKDSPYMEGISLMPLIKGQRSKIETYAISERDMLVTLRNECWSIMNDRWKLYNSCLYDLKNDTEEKIDVSDGNMNIKKSLRKRAIRFLQANRILYADKKAKLDKKEKELLKALGYIK